MRAVIVALSLASHSASAFAQSASPQTAPSPWSLQDRIGAPDDLKLSATLRVRWESIAGQPRSGFEPRSDTLNVRTSIFAEYRTGSIRIGGELYDSRIYYARDRTPISTSEVNVFEPIQTYAAVDLSEPLGAGSKATVQAGRFIVNLGSRRLVAADDYRNTTSSYTGVRADIALKQGLRATALYVLPTQRLPSDNMSLRDNAFALDREGFDAVLWGGQVLQSKAIDTANAEVSFFHFGERDRLSRATRDRSLNTIAVRIFREPAPARFDFEVEPIYQWGTISASSAPGAQTVPVSASFIHATIGYSFSHRWKPRLSLRFDRASGDGPGRNWGRFDTLFGMRRAELAPSGLYNSVGRANMMSPAIRLELVPSKRKDAFIHYRPIWLASRFDTFSTTNIRDASGTSGTFAGHQIEARFRHWLVINALRFEINLLYLAKGRFLRDAPGAPENGNTRYGSFNMMAFF